MFALTIHRMFYMADTTIAFFGIRRELSENEIETLEDRSHPAISQSRIVGLEHYWGNFGSPGERYLLFIGKSVGKIGIEDSLEAELTADVFGQLMSDVSRRLSQAGYSAVPKLFLQLQPDN